METFSCYFKQVLFAIGEFRGEMIKAPLVSTNYVILFHHTSTMVRNMTLCFLLDMIVLGLLMRLMSLLGAETKFISIQGKEALHHPECPSCYWFWSKVFICASWLGNTYSWCKHSCWQLAYTLMGWKYMMESSILKMLDMHADLESYHDLGKLGTISIAFRNK
jgi:hypothetical protein